MSLIIVFLMAVPLVRPHVPHCSGRSGLVPPIFFRHVVKSLRISEKALPDDLSFQVLLTQVRSTFVYF